MTTEEKLALANRRSEYNKYNGIRVVELTKERCVTEGELRPEALNPWGMAHGGFIYSLCDVAAGVLACQLERKGVTLSGNMHYLRPSKGAFLRAEAHMVKNGRSVALVRTEVYDDTGTLTACGDFEIFITEDTK